MKITEGARNPFLRPNVKMPDELAIAGVKEGNFEAVPIATSFKDAASVAFGLFEDVLRVDGDFLGFNDAEEFAADEQSVIGRAVGSGKFFDCDAIELRKIEVVLL